MELKLDRKYKKQGYTIGKLYVNGEFFCDTVEDEDRELEKCPDDESLLSVKVYAKTAIPKGKYAVRLTVSPRFKTRSWAAKYGGKVPELVNVRGFSGVRIHPGNTAEDLEGCIAPGENKIKGGVINSTAKFTRLMDGFLLPAFQGGEQVTLEIV